MKIKPLVPFFKHRSRNFSTVIDTIVIHHSAGSSLHGALSALRANGLGYHYIIDKDGTVYKGAPAISRVGHAGVSSGPQGKNCNEYSIGICFIHEGTIHGDITGAQKAAGFALIIDIKRAMPLIEWLTSHRLITMDDDRSGRSRKVDLRPFDADLWVANTGLKLWEPWDGASEMPY